MMTPIQEKSDTCLQNHVSRDDSSSKSISVERHVTYHNVVLCQNYVGRVVRVTHDIQLIKKYHDENLQISTMTHFVMEDTRTTASRVTTVTERAKRDLSSCNIPYFTQSFFSQ